MIRRDQHTDRQLEWFPIESVAEILGLSVRAVYDRLIGVRPSLVREEPNPAGVGRPHKLYHYTALPELYAHHQVQSELDTIDDSAESADPIHPDDLAVARLRVTAVKEYLGRCRQGLSREQAAEDTAAAWSRRPRSISVEVVEQLPGGHQRKHRKIVTVGPFAARTVREWSSLYIRDGKNMLSQAPSRKGKVGRRRAEISGDLLTFIQGLCANYERESVQRAVELARQHWTETPFPEISIRTWQRRLAELPNKSAMESLGRRGVAHFRNNHSPDIERDWSALPYNGLYEIDDVRLDFYGHSGIDPTQLVRPYVYAVMRVATRQFVSFVVSEVPITAAQVNALVGWTFASAQGGIPDQMSFERGTVARSPELTLLLDQIGVCWHDATVDGGRTWSGSIPDAPVGHSRSKAVCESNWRRLHNIMWRQVAQVGAEERHTAPANLEPLKAESVRRLKAGERTLLPQAHQWRAFIASAFETHNTMPHEGLPKIFDEKTGGYRHASPNERAAQLKDESVNILSPELIPAFSFSGRIVPVTKNGIQIGRDARTGRPRWYGRFDQDLQALAGRKVLAYAHDDMPEFAYVVELRRTIARYELEAPTGSEQFEHKRRTEKRLRNQFEELTAKTMAMEGQFVLEMTRSTENPTPDRHQVIVGNPEILASVEAIQSAQAEESTRATRFDRLRSRPALSERGQPHDESPTTSPPPHRRGRSIVSESRLDRLSQFATPTTQEES